MREDHIPMRQQTYGKAHNIHHWVNVGLVTKEGVTTDHYKCSGCPQERFVPKKIVRTFP